MTKRRAIADGLPYRVYERFGKRIYSVGYRLPNDKWAFRYSCAITDAVGVKKLRAKAITESARISVDNYDRPPGGFAGLIDDWFQWQESLPRNDTRKRASSTIAINKAEAKVLKNRDLMGATDPKKADKGTIRADFADSIDANAVHGSDAPETAKGEISYFFPALNVYSR
jgi:nucleoside-diphosphate kinase